MVTLFVERHGFAGYETGIFHICRLFFEEAECVYGATGDEDYRVILTAAHGGDEASTADDVYSVSVEVISRDGRRWNGAASRLLSGPEEGQRRTMNRAVGTALLAALQEATGVTQPWGTLTGVRPTKLVHQMLQNGMSREESILAMREQSSVSEEKAVLLLDIAERQHRVIPDLFQLDREVSVYIGIPFCPTKCAYCTFPAYDIRGHNGSVEAFLQGLHEEIRVMGQWMRDRGLGITTIYWGGGTPTSIEAEQMDALFETMRESFPDLGSVRELTVEAGRPDTITPDKIDVMKKWNVDRISINPQSFTQSTLDQIGRHHTVEETVSKFILSREMGLNNINMDLIIGLPNEGVAELQRTLEQTERLLPESVTVHTLSFKRASRMTQNRESYNVAGRDEVAEMIRMTADWTKKCGYHPYYMYRQKNILGNQENVGYALEGRESLYNIVMMEDVQTIIGLGCGAVSKIVRTGASLDASGYGNGSEQRAIERFANPKEPALYNSSYREYIDKKINLLNAAYGVAVR